MLNKNAKKHFSDYFNIDFNEPFKKIDLRKDPDKTLVISDIHAPYHHKQYLTATTDNNFSCQDLIIAGDWFDFYSRSHYQRRHEVNVRDEFREGYCILRETAKKFDTVYIMLSNHDERWYKYLYNNVPNDCIEFLYRDLFEDLLKTIPNLKICKQWIDKRAIGYIWQYRDVLFTHFEKSAKDIGKVVQELEKDLQRWQSVYKLKPYRAIFQAHNHVSCKIRFDSKFLFQLPCLIDINQFAFDYVFNGKIVGNPPALGYAVVQWRDGQIDVNNSHIYDYI